MTIRIRKVGYIVGSEIIFSEKNPNDFAAILANIEPRSNADGPIWTMSLVIGEGAARRSVKIELSRFMTQRHYEHSKLEPVKLTAEDNEDKVWFVLFKNRFFMVEPSPMKHEYEEMTLRVKRAVYKEEDEINSLKSYVSNMEAVNEYQRSGPQRIPIPNDVKLAAWARDGGACVQCGSKENIHFDHVIPVAKGGGNGVENIQILCAPCNLRKSDKIAP